jgi:hypothetical protein
VVRTGKWRDPLARSTASAEDIVAPKLHRFAPGDRAAERQWNEAIVVLRVAGPRLDLQYLINVAGQLRTHELLSSAAADAGPELPSSPNPV